MEARLAVDRPNLLRGLELFQKVTQRTRRTRRVVLGFDGGYLTVDDGTLLFVAYAVGTWPGNATIGVSTLFALAEVPPKEDPIILACDGEHVHFGPLKVACIWQPISAAALSQRARPGWHEGVALRYTMPRARIFAEGRGGELAAAERNLAALIRRVAKSLAPFGVSIDDIESLVERRLAERYAKPDESSEPPF